MNKLNAKQSRSPRRRKTVFAALFLAAAVVLGLFPQYAAFAAGTIDSSVTNVVQSGDPTDFFKDAELTSIIIDDKMLTDISKQHTEVTFLNSTDYPGFTTYQGSQTSSQTSDDYTRYNAEDFVVYDPEVAGAALTTEDNFFPGEIYKVVFKDAAVVAGGRADIVMTVSNIRIAVQNDFTGTFDGKVFLTKGNILRAGNTYSSEDIRTGVQMDIFFQVEKNGSPITGKFIYPIRDIDQNRAVLGGDASVWKKLYLGDKVHHYSEQIFIHESHTSKIYVPEKDSGNNAYMTNVTNTTLSSEVAPQGQGKLKGTLFCPVDIDNNDSYLSGFATVVDNSNGIHLTVWSAGHNAAPVRTFLLGGGISHTIVSRTTAGGNIQTTEAGNLNGALSDGTVMGPGTIGVPDGKSLVYTMKPEEGFRAGSILIGDEIDGSKNAVTVSEAELLSLKNNPGTVKEIELGKNINEGGATVAVRKGVLKYDSALGAYLFTFPQNVYHHYIYVSWITDLTVEKKVEPAADAARFPIAIALSGMPDGDYVIDKSSASDATDQTVLRVSDGTGNLTVNLKNGESVVVKGLYGGGSYTVSETDSPLYTEKVKVVSGTDTVLAETTGLTTGEQSISVDKANPTVTFTNYLVKPVKVDPPVKKVVKGNPPTKEEFVFCMKAVSNTAGYSVAEMPMPAESAGGIKRKTVKGEGEYEFGEITFTKPGSYVYEVTEEKGKSEGYTYDETRYTITWEVTDAEGNLEAKRTIKKNGGEEADTCLFENSYRDAKVVNTGDNSESTKWMGMLLLSMVCLVLLLRRKRVQSR